MNAATVSSEGLVLYANRRLAELLSCTTGELIGRTMSIIGGDGHAVDLDAFHGPGEVGSAAELDLIDGHGAGNEP